MHWHTLHDRQVHALQPVLYHDHEETVAGVEHHRHFVAHPGRYALICGRRWRVYSQMEQLLAPASEGLAVNLLH